MKTMKKRAVSFITAVFLALSLCLYLPESWIKASAANTAESLIAVAEGELGSTEYWKYYGGNRGAWCADFVSWCAQQAGVPSIALSSSCRSMYNGMIDNGCVEVSSPQRGDIVFYYCTYCGTYSHVGIMVDSTTSIDGNYSSKVSYDYSYSEGSPPHSTSNGIVIKKYVRPNYDETLDKVKETHSNPVDIGSDFYAYIEHQSTGLFLTDQNNNIAGETPTGSRNQIWHFIKQPDGYYSIQNVQYNSYMDIYGQYDEDGTNVYTWPEYTGNTNQQFYIYYAFDAFYFRPAHSKSRLLDMSLSENHNLELWGKGSDWEPQEFNIIKIDINGVLPSDLGYGFYANIENQDTGLLLTNADGNVFGSSASSNDNQIWHFLRQSNGAYSIQSQSDNSFLDVYGAFDVNDTNIYTWYEYTGALNQQFYIYEMYNAYYIRPAHTQSKMLDMNLSGNHNTSLWVKGEDWAPQEFNIKRIDVDGNLPVNIGTDFYATIENQSTCLFLTNQSNNIAGEKQVCSDKQVWFFTRLSNGAYKISSKFDNSVIDVYGGFGENGTNIYTWPEFVNGENQQFYIYKMYDAFYFRPVFTTTQMLDMSNSEKHNLELWVKGSNWAPQEFNIHKITDNIGIHEFSEWRTDKESTCTEPGSKSRLCARCLEVETEAIPAAGHTAKLYSAKSATCSAAGRKAYYYCTACKKYFSDKNCTKEITLASTVIPATGIHSFGNWKTTKAATASAEGTAERECSVCHIKETKTLPKLITGSQIVVKSVTAHPGSTVEVDISFKDNPGIVAAKLSVDYDTSVMTLTDAKAVDFSGAFFGPVSKTPFTVGWSTADTVSNTNNGVFARLTFTVKDTAADGEYPVRITYNSSDFYNVDLANVDFTAVDGVVKVVKYTPGDINGDGSIGMRDITDLQRYIVGWNVKIVTAAADCNGDGEISMKDLTLLQRYVSGWDVELA